MQNSINNHNLSTYYTFDDVALIPQYNSVLSRTHVNLDTYLTNTIKISNPLIPANMNTVINDDMADILIRNGSIPIFHRFLSDQDAIKQVTKFKNKCFASIGIQDNYRAIQLFDNGALGVCIDVAHCHSPTVINLIKTLKIERPNIQIIVGNICTRQAYIDLAEAGADCIKVCIGCGSACTTRIVTGFGIPQFSAIFQLRDLIKKYNVPIIADGGIRNPRDIALAIAAGANSVMLGSIFSKTYESAGTKSIKLRIKNIINDDFIKNNDYWFEVKGNVLQNYNKDIIDECFVNYCGQASKLFQDEFYGNVKKGTVPEGINFKAKVENSVQDIIDYYSGCLRSSLTYAGALNIKEFQNNAEFIHVTSSYMSESFPRPEKN